MSLVFPTITSDITNILLIDYRVYDFQVFVDSVNSTTLPIVFNGDSSSNELLELFNTHFTTISRIGIVFEITPVGSVFLDNEPYFSSDETPNSNTEFLISLIGQFQVQNIDFLACNTLNMPDWKAFYDVLGQSTNVVVGASNNETGNLQYGGDWIMESSCQDVEDIYFTESIEYYKYLLYGAPSFGQNAFILANDGTLYSSGGNGAGQLGLGPSVSDNSRNYWSTMLTTNTSGLTPKMISCGGIGDATTTTGVNVIVMMTDGSLFGCGGNDQGQLTNIASSTKLLTRMTNTTGLKPISVSAGGKHTLVLMNDGTVWACGDGTKGQLGNGNTNSTTSLTKITNIPGTSPVIQVAAGGSYPYTMVLCSNGQIYLCGDIRGFPVNGSVSVTTTSSFITMTMPTGNGIATKFSSSTSHMVILMSNGTIWGASTGNNNGNLGLNNNTTYILSLTQMLTTNATNSNISAGIYPIDVCCGSWWTLVLYSNGTVYGTGVNFEGELGIVGGGAFLKLTAVPGITGAVSLFANYAVSHILTSDGSLYSAGWNQFGSLGLGTSNHNTMLYTFTKPTSTILPKTIKYLVDSGVPLNGYVGSLANLRIVVGSSAYDPNASSVTTSKYQLTNAANTKLLFLGSSFVDNSTAAHTIAQIDPTDGGYISTTRFPSDIIQNAFYFSGTNSLSISPTDISFGLADYTIEFWFNTASFAATIMPLGTLTTNGLNIKLVSSTTIQVNSANVSNFTYTVPTMTVNTWINVIFVRKLQTGVYTHACFVNGIKNTSNTFGTSLTTNFSGATTTIGSVSGFTYTGYLANIRLVAGTAVYDPSAASLTSTYPKTLLSNVTNTKLFLLGDSFYDVSPSQHTITNNSSVTTSASSLGYLLDTDISGSYTFNGSNYITYTPSDLSFGLADFTIECCFKVNSFGGPIIGTSNSNGVSLFTQNSTSIYLDVYNVGAASYTVPTMITNTWYHLVVVRKLQSGSYTNALFLNGVKNTNTTSSLTYNMSGVSNRIGSSSFIGSVLNGSLTNLRVVVGTAIYDPNSPEIIPSFKKLTNVTNTKLLLLGESFVDGSTSAHTMTAGGVTVATFKY